MYMKKLILSLLSLAATTVLSAQTPLTNLSSPENQLNINL